MTYNVETLVKQVMDSYEGYRIITRHKENPTKLTIEYAALAIVTPEILSEELRLIAEQNGVNISPARADQLIDEALAKPGAVL